MKTNENLNRPVKCHRTIIKAISLFSLIIVISFSTACGQGIKPASEKNLFTGQMAPLLDGMSDYHFAISTDDTLAQRFLTRG